MELEELSVRRISPYIVRSDQVELARPAGQEASVQSRKYLSSVDRECFHYAGRWSLVISGTGKSVAAHLIVRGFMAALMVHLALT